jgi:hypothetical protein
MLINQPRIILAAIFAIILSVSAVSYTITKALSSKDLVDTKNNLIELARAGKDNSTPVAPPPPKRKVELLTAIPGSTISINDVPKVSMIAPDPKSKDQKPAKEATVSGNNDTIKTTESKLAGIKIVSVSTEQIVIEDKITSYTLKVGEVAKTTPAIKLLAIDTVARKISFLISDQEIVELY